MLANNQRQHFSNSMAMERIKESSGKFNSERDLAVMFLQKHRNPETRMDRIKTQYTGRLGEQSSRHRRLDNIGRNVGKNHSYLWHSRNRLFRFSPQHSMQNISLTMVPTECSSNKHLYHTLGPKLHVLGSPRSPNSYSFTKNKGRKCTWDFIPPPVDSTTMVQHIKKHGSRYSSARHRRKCDSTRAIWFKTLMAEQILEVCRNEGINKSKTQSIVELIIHKWAPTTANRYSNELKRYVSWCNTSGIPPFPSKPITLICYLDHRYSEGAQAAYSQLLPALRAIHIAAEVPWCGNNNMLRWAIDTIEKTRSRTPKAKVFPLFALLHWLKNPLCVPGNPRYKNYRHIRDAAFVAIGIRTGQRIEEIRHLRLADISLQRGLYVGLFPHFQNRPSRGRITHSDRTLNRPYHGRNHDGKTTNSNPPL